MTFSLIANTETGGGSGFTSDPVNTTGADLIVVSVGYAQGTSPSVSDNKGNTYTPLTVRTGTSWSHRLYYCGGPSTPVVGAGHTFTVSGSGILAFMAVQAWSGSHLTSVLDAETGAGSGAASTLQPGSITPSQNNELIVTGVVSDTGGLPSVDLGFSISDSEAAVGGSFAAGAFAYLVQTSAAAVNPTWTFGGANDDATSMAAFKAAAVGGGGGTTILMGQILM